MEWLWLFATQAVAVLLLLGNGAEGLKVLDKCTNITDCPPNSVCSARGCEGQACLCSEGFVPSINRNGCFKGAQLSRECDGENVLCRDPLALCTSGRCQCRSSFVPASDNLRCKFKPFLGLVFSLLGEFCDGTTALCQRAGEQNCDRTRSRCVCKPGLRPATPEELVAEPFLEHECRYQNFSLSLPVEDLVCIEPTLPVSAAVGEKCVSYNNCPDFADCLPRGCDGKVCVCSDGFYHTANGTECKPVAFLNETCDTDSVCHGEGVTTSCVEGVCRCDADLIPTPDGRCKPRPDPKLDYALLGEACGYVGDKRIICHDDWTTCDSVMDGTCICQFGTRNATNEEMAREMNNPSPCRLLEYGLETDDPDLCERKMALEQCQNWGREELFWREWFKQILANSRPDPPRENWHWMVEWKRHRDKLRNCTELMPITDDDNWSNEVREIRLN